ncbi:ActS/PrrB/RegB family redox-sensitive histidine kinase [Methylobrevis albus]|uniref:histidine kinase n=1 Tax=Methylobrevis albus TaxID=2793297 RepID=A0A931MZH7_9HYPH|nr:ActS/PrrB/RegB family redox-sensitive histidine kinase [Methylobrevis albus]MBH0237761.1 ActS/PrrB/RegB family redox-sensitive histidine kinase [Methylobrevis albus]
MTPPDDRHFEQPETALAARPVLRPAPGEITKRIKLDTLVRLRWLAITGQFATLVTVEFVLDYRLPIGPCLGLVALSAWLNLVLKIRYPASLRLDDRRATLLLGYDILQLAGLLYFTGGLGNPFSVLILAPVIVSSTALALKRTLMLGGLVVALASLLAFVHQPLPWLPAGGFTPPGIYTAGVWVALISAVTFMGAYSWRIAEEARQLQAALTATELVLSREQHNHQMDGLAAAAAHELGTPLATIALVSKEVLRGLPTDSPLREDMLLLREQAERCRDLLRKLTSLSGEFHDHLHQVPLSHLVEDVVAPHRDTGVDVDVTPQGKPEDEPTGPRNPAIVHGLANVIENAVDFARTRVDVEVAWDEDRVSVTVRDDGPGLAPGDLDRIGEPYFTTRVRATSEEIEAQGLGLGFFMAKTLLERTGAKVRISNRPADSTGAVIEIRWPRKAFSSGGAAGTGAGRS